MIADSKHWYYLTVQGLSSLLQGIALNHNADTYCINSLFLFRTDSKLKLHENVCKDNYCHVIKPEKDMNKLKYNQDKKSLKTQLLPTRIRIYA